LARIAREVKKKFEKQFQETSNSFKEYLTNNRLSVDLSKLIEE